MIWVWVTIGGLALFALVVLLALCKIAALAAEEARRALVDERWATMGPTRAAADDEPAEMPQVSPLRSKR
jgi:hypothetical protein